MKHIQMLPNLITGAGMMCGMLSMLETIGGNYEVACRFIIAAGVLDFFDGKIARMTNATSDFGVELDSLADLASFGVAPALMMFGVMTKDYDVTLRVASGVCVLFALCGALRLARFNVQSATEESKSFTGMPSPAAGGTLVAIYYALDKWGGDSVLLPQLMPIAIALTAYLMVSGIRYPSPKSLVGSRKPFDMLFVLLMVGCFLIALLDHFRMVIIGMAVIYFSLGIGLRLKQAIAGHGEIDETLLAPTDGLGDEEDEGEVD